MDIRTIFYGATLSQQIAGYTGLIETINAKINRLASSELEAAIRSLEQAATSEFERDSLLRDARSRFNKAISLEDNERLALSYMGLALCHFQLGDNHNGREALQTIDSIKMKVDTLLAKETGAVFKQWFDPELFERDKSVVITDKLEVITHKLEVILMSSAVLLSTPLTTPLIARDIYFERKEKLEELKSSIRLFLEAES